MMIEAKVNLRLSRRNSRGKKQDEKLIFFLSLNNQEIHRRYLRSPRGIQTESMLETSLNSGTSER